ncbi:MAG TPA: RHS repeat-associated core domain-containing protein, partial [Anaerolineales bacterium]|nr:RHS repeat-associated core domain-containing protein [Anaerolineales bacterium]
MNDNGVFKYFLSDRLVSVSLVLDSNGTILEGQRYLPFGAPRTMPPYATVASTDFTYTGQRDLPGTGLMDYKARFYSPYLNQFTQPDSIVPDPSNPQDWNRYSYARNNPLKYTDPSGHNPCLDDGYCGNISDTSYQKYIYSNAIKDVYKWNLKGNWTLKELKTIYQTGRDIEQYADSV